MYWETSVALYDVTKVKALRDARNAEISSVSLEGGYFRGKEHERIQETYAANRVGPMLIRLKSKNKTFR